MVAAGADLINDTWAGDDPGWPSAAADAGAGPGLHRTPAACAPRTDPHRVAYDDVVADVIATLTGGRARGRRAGSGATAS